MTMNWTELSTSFPELWSGLMLTFELLALAVAGGVILGTLLALLRLSHNKVLSFLAKCYIDYFRSVPILLVLLWFYFAVPMIYNWITGEFMTIDTAFLSCVIAFMVFEAAYFAEIVRAGIQSIPKGQLSAAYALGMTYGQAMRLIILPQTFRKMAPLLLQQSIVLFQDTTLVFAVGLMDFFRSAYVRGDLMGLLTPYILLAGGVYFIVSLVASMGVKKLQKKLAV